jgi:zona occludens toxin (predicted ATPase)
MKSFAKKIKEGKELEEGEHIFNLYANIDGLNIPGVKPSPEDWRECEAPAKWFYDEAQYTFPVKNTRGLDDNPIIAEVATHRHLGVDLFLITQHPGLISSHVRKFVGRHEHLDRRYGSGLVSIYMADNLMNVDSGLKRNESEVWTHPKKLFDHYKSASLHIDNKRLPAGLKFLAAFILTLVVVVGFSLYHAMGFITGSVAEDAILSSTQSDIKTAEANTKPPSFSNSDFQPKPAISSTNIYSGCISSETKCRCWLEDGTPVEMEFLECISTSDNLPTRNYILGG